MVRPESFPDLVTFPIITLPTSPHHVRLLNHYCLRISVAITIDGVTRQTRAVYQV